MSFGVTRLGIAVSAWHFLMFGATSAETIYVDRDATGPGEDGATWCTAYTDLQVALAAAVPGDQILVAGGVYEPDGGTGSRTATFRLKDRVVLLGGYAGCGASNPDARNTTAFPTVLSGDLNGDDGPDVANYADNSYHVVTYDDPNATGVVLDGFTVASGNANGASAPHNQGGGIHIRNGTVPCLPGGPAIRNCIVEKNWGAHHGAINDHGLSTVIDDCVIRSNYAGVEGGGLQIHSGAPTITDCVFENNESAGDGGGAWTGSDDDPTCSGPSAATFVDCTFKGNRAVNGGGLFTRFATHPTLLRCAFLQNEAVSQGGGVWQGGGPNNGLNSLVADCLFESNSANVGAGLRAGGQLTMTGCTFRANATPSAQGRGGAVWLRNPNAVFKECDFSENSAGVAGAIYLQVPAPTPPGFRCIDCAFDANLSDYAGAAVFGYGQKEIAFINCVFTRNSGVSTVRFGGASESSFVNCLFSGNVNQYGTATLEAFGGETHVVNSTFYANHSQPSVEGQAIRFQFWDFQGITHAGSVFNTILWANGNGTAAHQFHSCDVCEDVIDWSCIQGWSPGFGGPNNIGQDPLFVDPEGVDGIVGTPDDDLIPMAASPAIDAGDSGKLPTDLGDLDGDGIHDEPIPLDLAGNPRVLADGVDIGAYEQSDCNRNGTFDGDDIANGTSTDCDGNGVPDECDPDCNVNGVADGCDPDSDGDGTIDDCDGCPADAAKVDPGTCGCGISDEDSDGDTVPDCRDECPGFDDDADADGDGIADGCDPCNGVDLSFDCNHNGYSDPCEVLDGLAEDVDGNGVPDECDIAPGVTAEGCRALVFRPLADPALMALRLTATQFPCYERYLSPDGILTDAPVYLPGDEWGTLVVTHEEIAPAVQYAVEAHFDDGTVSAQSWATTAKWGDMVGDSLNTPPNGRVDFLDIGAVVACFKSTPNAPPLHRCDIHPATPDGRVDFLDIGATVQAFKSRPYPHPTLGPCP